MKCEINSYEIKNILVKQLRRTNPRNLLSFMFISFFFTKSRDEGCEIIENIFLQSTLEREFREV